MKLPFDRKWLLRGAIVAVVVAYFLFRDQLPSINFEHLIRDASNTLGSWTYLLVGGLAFLETGAFVGLVAPGEFTVILGGAVAGQGDASLPLMIAVTWLCAFLGDTCSFFLGARLGRSFLIRHGERIRISEARLGQVEDYFERHGGKTILIGRFIGLVRALAPFIAGSSKMRYGAFAPYSILGTGLWSTGLILAGYFASQSIDKVTHIVGEGLVVFGVLVGTVIAIVAATRYLRVPENRRKLVAEMEERRLLRPVLALGRRLRPQARFLWDRVTPGGRFGLEFTSLMAVVAVGLFVLVAYWSVISGDPGPTAGDTTAANVAEDLGVGWLTSLAKGVTELGSALVVIPLALIAAVGLGVKRRWAQLAVLVVGTLTIMIGPQLIKEWTDRPRPEGGLVDAGGSSFPSAHAAHAVFYTWVAVTVAYSAIPGLTRRGLVVAAGLVVTALIGLSRVYLGVHWLSDVSAGWGLGFSAFAAAGAAALVFAHIGDNSAPDGRDRDIADERAAAGGRL